MIQSLLQITPYALVEYNYDITDLGTDDISFILIDSSYTNSRQILNETKGNNPTSNILDRSSVKLSDSRIGFGLQNLWMLTAIALPVKEK